MGCCCVVVVVCVLFVDIGQVQARSTEHPELDGAFMRAFDYEKWENWASDADVGWGAWSVESGWTQSWITTVLGMRVSE